MTEAHGKLVWNELNTRDIEGAKRFLSTTLGWTFESMPIPDGTYWIAKKREERIGGLYDMNGDALQGRARALAILYRGRQRRRAL
jgi:predicted enzyme related to lactoylglutathione lyase